MSNRTYLYLLRYYWSEPCTLSLAQCSGPAPLVYPVRGSTPQHPSYTAVTGYTVVKPDHISVIPLLWNFLKWNSGSTNLVPYKIKTEVIILLFLLNDQHSKLSVSFNVLVPWYNRIALSLPGKYQSNEQMNIGSWMAAICSNFQWTLRIMPLY